MYVIDQPRSCRCLVYLTVFIIIIILNLLDNIVRNIRLHCNKFHPHCNVLFVFPLITATLHDCSNSSAHQGTHSRASNLLPVFLKLVTFFLKKNFWAITGLIVSAALLLEISKKEWPFLRNGVTATKKQVTLGTVCLIYLCYIQCFILIGYMCRGSFYFPLFWGMVMSINGKLKFKLRIKLNQNIILYKDVQKKNWCRLHEVIIYTSEVVHHHTTSYEQKWSHSSGSKWKVKFKLYTLIINYRKPVLQFSVVECSIS